MAFGGCVSALDFAILRLDYLVTSADCCEFQIAPHPSAASGKPELSDCALNLVAVGVFNVGFVSTTGSGDCSYSPPPTNPSVADNATNVGLNPLLAFDINDPHACSPLSLGSISAALYLGKTSDPPLLIPNDGIQSAWVTGPLDPETKYYWKVVVNNYGYSVEGPVWSFTTQQANAVEHKTWGAVKALYK
jgi:hypothetical protein